MLYHIDDDPDSTAHAAGGTGDLTAVGVASVANAAAAAVIASATSAANGNSRKSSMKVGTNKTVESPTSPPPEKIPPGVCILFYFLFVKKINRFGILSKI